VLLIISLLLAIIVCKLLQTKTVLGGSEEWYTGLEKQLNMKVVKELASGGNGTAYLVIKNGKQLVLKVEKQDVHDKDKPLTSEYLRQVDFNELAKKHPDKFMVLSGHGIIKKCSYIHPLTSRFINHKDENRRRRFKRKNSSTECYWLLYEPFLDGVFESVKEEVMNNDKLWYSFIDQMLDIISILKKNGYSQNDWLYSNIMFKKEKNQYRWYLIDYGQIMHIKYPTSQLDIDLIKRDTYRNNDMVSFLKQFSNLVGYSKKHNMKLMPFEDFKEKVKNTEEYNKIHKLKIPEKNIYKVLLALYFRKMLEYAEIDNTKQWYLPIHNDHIKRIITLL
jgi:hypothetical protein